MTLTDVFTAEQVEALKNAFVMKNTGDFWDEIEYFQPKEFWCKCGGKYCNHDTAQPQEGLVRALEKLRKTAGKPIIISSGVRCATHNSNVGGVYNSHHLYGNAADFSVGGLSSSTVISLVKSCGIAYKEMYAIDGTYVHIAIV